MAEMQRFCSVLIAGVILLLHAACQQQATVGEQREDYENQFFRLDLRADDVSLADIEKYFFMTFPHDDPTEGDVVYDRRLWGNQEMQVLRQNEGLFLYVKARQDSNKFDSSRLTSKAYYNLANDSSRILFVYKGQLPSARGVWPAWWLNGSHQAEWVYGDAQPAYSDATLDRYSGKGRFYNTVSAVNPTDWPAAGEVDIIETINGDNIVHNTIHTCPMMCNSEWNDSGVIKNCAAANTNDPNPGCSGEAYLSEDGRGTFACLWQKDRFTFYYWPPDSAVDSAHGPLSEQPRPDTWAAQFRKNTVRMWPGNEPCEDEKHQRWQCENCAGKTTCSFTNMKMIFNITLCGKWAGNKFDASEKALANCQEYILGPGRDSIDGQYMRIEYVAVLAL
jgi:hypothetical protein